MDFPPETPPGTATSPMQRRAPSWDMAEVLRGFLFVLTLFSLAVWILI